MSIAEIEAWLTTATGRAKQIVASALAEGNEDQARQIIAALEESKRTGGGARRRPPMGPLAGRQPPARARAASPPPSRGNPRTAAATPRGATARPIVQKGGLYRGKPHAYVAGGKVTDTNRATRRKR